MKHWPCWNVIDEFQTADLNHAMAGSGTQSRCFGINDDLPQGTWLRHGV